MCGLKALTYPWNLGVLTTVKMSCTFAELSQHFKVLKEKRAPYETTVQCGYLQKCTTYQ